MNCLEFRRRLLTDPLAADDDLLRHEADCADCAAYAQRVRADEVRLRGLLRSVTPPDGMTERIQLAARFERRAESRRRVWYSAAAGVLLAVGVSLFSVFNTSLERGNVALAQSVLNHIEDEASHLRAAHPVTAARVRYVFRRFGAELATDIGPVNFAAECLMRTRNGVHLVMPGRAGPVTVFFMPGEMAEATMPVRSARFEGRILPTDWGSIAVVGEIGEELDGLGERLAASVRWPRDRVAGSGAFDRRLVGRPGLAQQQDG